jgi:hypothetical protein
MVLLLGLLLGLLLLPVRLALGSARLQQTR